jgi:outer membrane protein
MRSLLKFWFLCFIFSGNALFGALTLEECYKLAISQSEKMSLADLRALIEEDRTREVWGMALPQLSAEADFITKGDVRHIHHHNRTKNARVSLMVPIFNFGAYNAISAQEKKQEAAIIDIDRARQEVLFATHRAYFTLLEAHKVEMILQESMQTLQTQLKITKDFKEHGLVHDNELLLVEVELALLQQDLMQAENQIGLAVAKLNRLIGCEMDYPTEIVDVLEQTVWNGNFHQILFRAKNTHPTLRSLTAQIEAACYTHKAEKGKLYPSIYGYGNYSTTNDYALPYKHGLDAGIGMQISLYDGGTTWAKLKRLKKEQEELEQRYAAEEKNIELNIRTAFLNVENALQKLPLALKGIELAKSNLKLTQDHFAEGLITNMDVVNDEEKLFRARFNYYQALYQFHQAKADLAYAAGSAFFIEGCTYDE